MSKKKERQDRRKNSESVRPDDDFPFADSWFEGETYIDLCVCPEPLENKKKVPAYDLL